MTPPAFKSICVGAIPLCLVT